MGLITKDILLYKNLKGLGNVTAFKLCEYAILNNVELISKQDFLDFYNSAREKKIARGMKEYNINDIIEANNLANEIIHNSEMMDIKIVSYYDKLFPSNLKKIKQDGRDSPPIILYYKGNINNILDRKAVTIIGTREVTNEGVISGEYISKKIADNGFNIVSGLAIGCDTVAHIGALKSSKGITTAILAHGLDTIYPKENKNLATQILEKNGILISEYPIGTKVRGNYLVERDRLQAGLADATIVIQTGIKGGTMHAVNTTLENNKPLFAISYKNSQLLEHEKVQGNIMLLEQNKAKPITSSNLEDIITSIKVNSKILDNSNQSFDLFNNVNNLENSKIQCVIFDLDQTLVDTSGLEIYRNKRQWGEISKNLNLCKLYNDIETIITTIKSKGIKLAVVTSSPGSYAKQILDYFNLEYDILVAYHDVKNKKPHNEPMSKVLNDLKINASSVISFGDSDIDIISSNNAKIKSVACLWGAKNKNTLIDSNPDFIIDKPNQILKMLWIQH